MDFQSVGAPGSANYAAPLMNFGIPGVTSGNAQQSQPSQGQPHPDWVEFLRRFMPGGPQSQAASTSVPPVGATTGPAANAAATGTSPQPPNPYNQASPYYSPGFY